MRNPGGGYGNPGARSRGGAGNAYQNDYMEQQNDEQINLIAGKVGQLKELSIAIGSHDNSFDSAGSLLSGTMKRLGSLADSGGNRHMLYLALFVIFVLLLVYKLFR